jgi:hypothetical protein
MPEKEDVQPEQEEKKELTVEDLDTVAGGTAEEEFGTKIDEAGDVKGIET